MSVATSASLALHVLFAGLWTGAVGFYSLAVLPLAGRGDLDASPLGSLTKWLQRLSRTSTVVLVLTGLHLAFARYSVAALTGSGRGHLVLTMAGLWLVLTVLVEVGGSRVKRGVDAHKVREPAKGARRVFQTATVVAAALLVVAGLLAVA